MIGLETIATAAAICNILLITGLKHSFMYIEMGEFFLVNVHRQTIYFFQQVERLSMDSSIRGKITKNTLLCVFL